MTRAPDPERLVDGKDDTARLLADANRSFSEDVDEARAWRRLRDRLDPGTTAPRWPWAAVTLAAAAGAALWFARHPLPATTIEMAQEPAPPVATASLPASAPAADETLAPPAPSSTTALPVPAPSTPDCARSTQELAPQQAARCLAERAATPGLAGERALLELATLRRERLGDATGAVAALREHRARYPEGVLRGEVDFALVELLPTVGAVEEALAESARLLEKPWGRNRASELYLTRGRLYQDRLGDCSHAVIELGAIRSEFGPQGDEAEYRYGQCLEQLGDGPGARAAFARYLERPSPRHADAARARLHSLQSATTPTAPSP